MKIHNITIPIKIYMFGYWGWGSSTKELVESVDAVEQHRGFAPPIFVDVRIHRSVQAKGFANNSFEKTLGQERYIWMSDLGNESVLPESKSDKVGIRSPKAASKLLEHAEKSAIQNSHAIFFCSCEYPRYCHRYVVAELLRLEACRRNVDLEVVEWPGNAPTPRPVDVLIPNQKTALGKRLSVGNAQPLWKFAGLPFGASVKVLRGKTEVTVPVAPARRTKSGWYLPILQDDDGNEVPATKRAITAWRHDNGYESLVSKSKP